MYSPALSTLFCRRLECTFEISGDLRVSCPVMLSGLSINGLVCFLLPILEPLRNEFETGMPPGCVPTFSMDRP